MLRPEVFPAGVVAFFTDSSGPAAEEQLLRVSGMQGLYLPRQEHTDRVILVEKDFEEPVVADGVITLKRSLLLGVRVADCLPVLVYAPEVQAVGAVHAGWRGTAQAILRHAIRMLVDMGQPVEDILLAFGPSIRGCCYRVGPEVVEAISKVTPQGDFIKKGPQVFNIDILKANILQAIDEGIREENIWVSEDCTCCSNGRYFSYRRDRTIQRQGGYIGLR